MSIPPDELMGHIVQEVEDQVGLYLEVKDAASIRQLATLLHRLTEQVVYCLSLVEAPSPQLVEAMRLMALELHRRAATD